ncbi:MAG: cobalt-precorrin-5B (C(1))-methyltransferase CbiD [Desulfobacterales bacterium]|nr:cobalt-precorrin-5B (C(1))-methyltransferase CbiD [Desulfobacterales bacterium]
MRRKLKSGFTTGTAAAAAAKGALVYLLKNKAPKSVKIELLTGQQMTIAIHDCERLSKHSARCTVIKDAGDDPDVTHKAEIGAMVTLEKPPSDSSLASKGHTAVQITGGTGVGKITKPGLEMPPGEPAINSGPRKMIHQAIHETLSEHNIQRAAAVEVFVPKGEEIAKKTLNARLGILGGISILGTTGLVRPMSHDAFIATIESALSVARASGNKRVVLTTGRRSERYAQQLWPHLAEEAFVQIGDFFKQSLEMAAGLDIVQITLGVFFGKAVKMAQGVPHTHAAKSRLTLDKLANWTLQVTQDSMLSAGISAANTARHAFDMIYPNYPVVVAHVGKKAISAAKMFAGQTAQIQCVIFDYSGKVAFDSTKD